MKDIFQKHALLIGRVVYLGLALLWSISNINNYILSCWDAHRVNVPTNLYLMLPTLVLILYAIIPTISTWILVITIFTVGWGLHVYKSLQFDLAHMGIKVDTLFTVKQIAVFVLFFAVCVLFLYAFGPYTKNKYKTKS